MSDLVFELLSEEIPARLQASAERQLGEKLRRMFADERLPHADIETFSGPRRLAALVTGVAARSEDVAEERKGPKTSAPAKALEGFARSAGLDDISEAEIIQDAKKGEIYAVRRTVPGRDAGELLAEALPDLIEGFDWPKSMRSAREGGRWVRPLRSILCVLDGKPVAFDAIGVASGAMTYGHRVHGPGPFPIRSAVEYREVLEGEGRVMLSRDDRLNAIERATAAAASKRGLRVVEDKSLLQEVAGMAERPVAVLGEMDPSFLELPPEVIRLSMRVHQKYFAVQDADGKLAPNFITIADLGAEDGGALIAKGNARVLSARLEDARFFYRNDLSKGLSAMAPGLARLVFKEGLGSMADKAARIAELAEKLAPHLGADPAQARRAGELAKADLVSEMVYEFPELQGVMGRYYALDAGEGEAVADAIGQHYLPQGPSDPVPSEAVAATVALADKLDTLIGFWSIGELPTGSKDPYALRRAALGVVRILLEHDVGLDLPYWLEGLGDEQSRSLQSFMRDRLAQALRDGGKRHDLVAAVMSGGEPDLARAALRIEALSAFLATAEGGDLLAGFKRAANILKAEAGKALAPDSIDESLIAEGPEAERALYASLQAESDAIAVAMAADNFKAALAALARLRAPVDDFFDQVMVNDDRAAVRANRLALLSALIAASGHVADFAQVEG